MNPELIEQYRDINTDCDWWDCIYDSFTEDMKEVGIDVRDMRFSGFWSQGDGASFTGYIGDNKLFFEHHKLGDKYPWLTKLIAHGGDFALSIVRTSHHYVHENTVSVELSHTDMFHNVLPDDDVRAEIIRQWDYLLDGEYEGIAQAATDIIRDYCRDLYQQLEDEYEYLTSDEAVWEAIVANELDQPEEEEV